MCVVVFTSMTFGSSPIQQSRARCEETPPRELGCEAAFELPPLLTLCSKSFSPSPRGTCLLSVSNLCSALEEIYHPLCAHPRDGDLGARPEPIPVLQGRSLPGRREARKFSTSGFSPRALSPGNFASQEFVIVLRDCWGSFAESCRDLPTVSCYGVKCPNYVCVCIYIYIYDNIFYICV